MLIAALIVAVAESPAASAALAICDATRSEHIRCSKKRPSL